MTFIFNDIEPDKVQGVLSTTRKIDEKNGAEKTITVINPDLSNLGQQIQIPQYFSNLRV